MGLMKEKHELVIQRMDRQLKDKTEKYQRNSRMNRKASRADVNEMESKLKSKRGEQEKALGKLVHALQSAKKKLEGEMNEKKQWMDEVKALTNKVNKLKLDKQNLDSELQEQEKLLLANEKERQELQGAVDMLEQHLADLQAEKA